MNLEELFGTILDLDPATLSDETEQARIKAWDSMAQINLITAMEEAYDVSFSTQEIQSITSLGAARRLLRQKGAAV